MVLKLGHFGEYIRNTWEIFKCGAGEGWRRSCEKLSVMYSQGGKEYSKNKKNEG
jgi:hypothetical protein